MQVAFVWYHYFAAKEFYNWIRVFIAAYVWMTGFGNFSFFWVRRDYSLWRLLKMMWRLNFLVIMICLTISSPYMLYYICAMHTYWFLSTYAFMSVLSGWNNHRLKMAAKFVTYFVCNAIIFEFPPVFRLVFRPFRLLLQFHDGKHIPMHEWEFRCTLDHWACFVGMLCAYNYSNYERFVRYLEGANDTSRKRNYLRASLRWTAALTSIAAGGAWHRLFMRQEKFAYNSSHPYSSMIPILVYIHLRNSCSALRRNYMRLFQFLGSITLETYLSQLHVYLQSDAKDLISYLPGYPMLTFALSTAIFLTISYKLFHVTTELSILLSPDVCGGIFLKRAVLAVLGLGSFLLVWLGYQG